MKCWHLVAALGLAACGLNSAPVPQAGGAFDAGASDSATAADMGGQATIAGSPASWPTRRRLPPLVRDKSDGGSSDTPGAGGAAAAGNSGKQGGATDPTANPTANQGGQPGSTNPGQSGPAAGSKNPPSAPGAKAGQDAGPSSSSTKPSNGSHASSDAGGGSSAHADAGSGKGHAADKGNKGSKDDKNDKADNDKDHGSSSGSNKDDKDPDEEDEPDTSAGGSQDPTSSDSVGAIADLVLAIVDLSLTGSPPAIQQLVSAILVLSLSPVELAADSLTEVLDALDGTQICRDNPDHCDPLCQDLEKECKVCDGDEDCIKHIEETCNVHLPDWCY